MTGRALLGALGARNEAQMGRVMASAVGRQGAWAWNITQQMRVGRLRESGQGRVRRRIGAGSPISRVPLLHGPDFDAEAGCDPTIVPAVPAKVSPFVTKVGIWDGIEGQPLVHLVNVVAVVVCHAC